MRRKEYVQRVERISLSLKNFDKGLGWDEGSFPLPNAPKKASREKIFMRVLRLKDF